MGIAAAIFAIASCQKADFNDNTTPTVKETAKVFELFASTAEVKTTNDGLNTKWAENDGMTVFHAVAGSSTYKNDGEFSIDNIETGHATGTLSEELVAGTSYDWYAIYPYDSHYDTPAETSCYLTVGGKNQTQNGIDSKAHLAGTNIPLYGTAKSIEEGNPVSITMNNACSVIAIKVTNNTSEDLSVSNVSFTGTEDIVGTYYINFASDLSFESSGASYVSSTASLSVTGSNTLAPEASGTFYIAIKPFTAANGGQLKLIVNGYAKTLDLTKDVVFSAGKIKTLNFNYDKTSKSSIFGSDWNSLFGTSYDGSFSLSQNSLNLNGTVGDVTMAVTNGTSTNGYIKSGDFRFYNGYTITVSVPVGCKIIAINAVAGGKALANITALPESTSTLISDGNLSWSGNSRTVVFSVGNTTSFSTMTVDYEGSPVELPALSAPTNVKAALSEESEKEVPNSIDVTWNSVENAGSYEVTFSASGKEPIVENVATTSCTKEDLEYETEYTITVVAIPSDPESYKKSASSDGVVITTLEEPVITDYSAVYTSNVTLSTTGGTSASTCKVVIGGNEYNGIKAGSGKASGACKITVPSGTTKLYLHAAGWNGETVTLSVSPNVTPSSLNLITDSGIASNSPFTIKGDATKEYFVLTLSNIEDATELTFSATSGNRFVIWGVNAK